MSVKIAIQLCLFICLIWCQEAAGAQSMTIKWQDNSHNENGFVIERTLAADCSDDWSVIAYTGANQNHFTDTRLPGACYRVAAFNDYGVSSYSDIAQSSNDSVKPKKPKKPKSPKKRKSAVS